MCSGSPTSSTAALTTPSPEASASARAAFAQMSFSLAA